MIVLFLPVEFFTRCRSGLYFYNQLCFELMELYLIVMYVEQLELYVFFELYEFLFFDKKKS